MKNRIKYGFSLLTILLIMTSQSFGQESFKELIDKYRGEEGYSSVYISKYMFKLFADFSENSDDKEFNEIVKNLTSMEILTPPDSKSQAFYEESEELLNDDYKELMKIVEGQEEVTFLIREKNDVITELIMLAYDKNETVLINLSGNIDLKQISKLSKSMNIDGMEHLEKVHEQP